MLTIDILVVLGVLLLAIILFATETFSLDVTALLILGILFVAGYLTPAEAISGFSNPAVVTIAILFVLSHALQKTGVLEYIIVRIYRLAERSRLLGLSAYLLAIALASAVVNNTAVVAIFIPVTIRLAHRYKISPSKVLIPLSYAAILGGTLTLIGTSTNLLVNSIYLGSGPDKPLGMFEFARYGIIQLTVGLVYILFVAYRWLPSRTVTSSLTKSYHLGGYLTEVKITPESPLVGKTCLERGLNRNYDVMVLDILRDKKLITNNIRNTELRVGDILFVKGSLDNFLRLKEVEKVSLLTDEKLTQRELVQKNNVLVECLLTDKSELVGKSLMEANFRRRYGCFVLAIRREGAILRRKIAHVILNAYDTLLVYGPREKIRELSETGDFLVLEELEAELKKKRFWWLSPAVILAAILLAAVGVFPILEGVLLGLIILLVFRVITPNESYQSIRWQVIILIAALIPLGIAIQNSGTAAWIGHLLSQATSTLSSPLQPYLLLAMVYLLTMVFTEVTSNAAAAIIMTPITLAITSQMNLDPRPFIFGVCFAASASFITPVGYQTNLMIYGPGGYKYTDYVRVGLPLGVMLWLLATLLLPILWPFSPA